MATARVKITGEAGNGRDAARFIIENKPDLVFLDIQMPEMDGFSILKNLDINNLPAIIFTTAFEEYAIHAFEFHALDYLLKPFDAQRFQKARLKNRSKYKNFYVIKTDFPSFFRFAFFSKRFSPSRVNIIIFF